MITPPARGGLRASIIKGGEPAKSEVGEKERRREREGGGGASGWWNASKKEGEMHYSVADPTARPTLIGSPTAAVHG